MKSSIGEATGRRGPRRATVAVLIALATASLTLVGTGAASGAVPGSKAKITTIDCNTDSCQIMLTIRGVVKVTPTGTVKFTLGTTPIAAAGGGSCSASPMVGRSPSTARATCDAAGLSLGRHKITATYSGDNNFDPSTTIRSIRVFHPAGS